MPELIALDLFTYPVRAGGISHIATVLSELVEQMDADRLISVATDTHMLCQLQRIGYVLERLDVMDEEKKRNILTLLEDYLHQHPRRPIALTPGRPITGCSRCKKWNIIENTDFESDL